VNCRKVNQLLSAYIDGELRGIEQRQVFEHVARCSDCDEEYESLLQMKRMLGCMRTHQPSPDLQARITYAITWDEAQSANRSPAMIWMRLRLQAQDMFGPPRALGMGAVAMLGIFVLVHQLPVAAHSGAPSTIVWQQTPNSVTELTAGLTPSEPQRFFRPPSRSVVEPFVQEHSGFFPVNARSIEPAPAVSASYRPEVFQFR
jgi:predicted anti-sigma-YlaC factor YlaD